MSPFVRVTRPSDTTAGKSMGNQSCTLIGGDYLKVIYNSSKQIQMIKPLEIPLRDKCSFSRFVRT